jgi:hypothetical protein
MMHADTSRFFRVPRTTHSTSEGPVELPILYYDVTNAVALFLGDRAGVADILAEAGLEVAVTRGDKALVAISFYEYRNTTVGVYNEVGVAVFGFPSHQPAPRLGAAQLYAPLSWRKVGAYVVDLPVTTAAANAAGRELWGYPKFVTEIPFQLDGRAIDTGVVDPDDGEMICELEGTLGRGVPAPPMSLMTYSRKDGALYRTHIDVRGVVKACGPGTTRLRVGNSSHRMANNLRRLGLTDARPQLVLVTRRFQSKLHAGRPVT